MTSKFNTHGLQFRQLPRMPQFKSVSVANIITATSIAAEVVIIAHLQVAYALLANDKDVLFFHE